MIGRAALSRHALPAFSRLETCEWGVRVDAWWRSLAQRPDLNTAIDVVNRLNEQLAQEVERLGNIPEATNIRNIKIDAAEVDEVKFRILVQKNPERIGVQVMPKNSKNCF